VRRSFWRSIEVLRAILSRSKRFAIRINVANGRRTGESDPSMGSRSICTRHAVGPINCRGPTDPQGSLIPIGSSIGMLGHCSNVNAVEFPLNSDPAAREERSTLACRGLKNGSAETKKKHQTKKTTDQEPHKKQHPCRILHDEMCAHNPKCQVVVLRTERVDVDDRHVRNGATQKRRQLRESVLDGDRIR